MARQRKPGKPRMILKRVKRGPASGYTNASEKRLQRAIKEESGVVNMAQIEKIVQERYPVTGQETEEEQSLCSVRRWVARTALLQGHGGFMDWLDQQAAYFPIPVVELDRYPADLRNMLRLSPAEPSQCYFNCQKLVFSQRGDRYRYYEGWICNLPLPIQHAWIVGEDGTAYDPTWIANRDSGRSTIVKPYRLYGVPIAKRILRQLVVTTRLHKDFVYDYWVDRAGLDSLLPPIEEGTEDSEGVDDAGESS